MGIGPYHAEMLAGMIGHPWKQMGYCFCKTEEMLGMYKQKNSKASITAAQAAGCEATLKTRGSGGSYNSNSGCRYFIGVYTILLIGSKNSAKGESSKSMESIGAADLIQELMEGETDIFLNEIVIDDDATAMSAIQRKEDGGLLPDYATVVSKLADLNHQTRGFGDYLYELHNTSQKQSR
eukprot:4668481-Ditylum_brightwellii.AAC.1